MDLADSPILEYQDRSVLTTWAISYQAIRKKNEATANLLLLWAFLDHKDLWYGLFSAACEENERVAEGLSEWIGGIASNELEFTKAMRLLRNYSMIEDVEDSKGYATHPVLHRWAYNFQGDDSRLKLS